MDEETRNAIAAELLASIEELGVPSGAWLVDIDRMRADLEHTQKVLWRMENAIIRAAKPLDDESTGEPAVRRHRRTRLSPPSRVAVASARRSRCQWRTMR